MKLPKADNFLRPLWSLIAIFLMSFGLVSNASSHAGRGINGGQLVDSGAIHVELIAAEDEILMVALTNRFRYRGLSLIFQLNTLDVMSVFRLRT